MDEFKDIPIVLSMPRSASRVTWQIVRELTFRETVPAEYEKYLGKEMWADISSLERPRRVVRYHGYIPSVPAIYTYRHPLEAFISLKQKLLIDIDSVPAMGQEKQSIIKTPLDAETNALEQIKRHALVYKKLKDDQANGRHVLFLKYEEYYGVHKKRVTDISKFMEVHHEQSHLDLVTKLTSLSENFERGRRVSLDNPNIPFTNHEASISGMQRDHVSKETMGSPEAWLSYDKGLATRIAQEDEEMKALCDLLGYDLSM